jgi:hypothetical protein
METLEGLATILFFLYFLPTLIAISRWYGIGRVFALNLFLGWTLVGWVVALTLALTPKAKTTVQIVQNTSQPAVITEDRRPCPSCAERILAQAKVCHFCKEPTGFAQ